MIIQDKTVVSLVYTLRTSPTGAPVEVVEKDKPFVFLLGVGSLLPDFEANLKGKQPNDFFQFMITAKNGYGEVHPERIVTLPKNIFSVEGQPMDLAVGMMVPMRNEQGNVLRGYIKELHIDSVVMDFNHPLAGQDLYFSGQVLEVRMATPDEIAHGHVHGPGGIHH